MFARLIWRHVTLDASSARDVMWTFIFDDVASMKYEIGKNAWSVLCAFVGRYIQIGLMIILNLKQDERNMWAKYYNKTESDTK